MSIENKQLQKSVHQEELIKARLKMQGDNSHHMEIVSDHLNITWINHSIATTIDMTWFVLRDVPGPVILIIGGVDRADDHEKLNQLITEKVNTVIALGSTPWKYFESWKRCTDLFVCAKDIKEAVEFANILAKQKSGTILFSPSCPSYDPFDNYKNRGNVFRDLVKEELSKIPAQKKSPFLNKNS